jgi:hypothetical protein
VAGTWRWIPCIARAKNNSATLPMSPHSLERATLSF